jgi:putative phage-type endonuclease
MTIDTHSPEWHAERATGIGSSDIAAILGLSRYGSAWSVWAEKAGLIPGDDREDTERLATGRLMEPVLAELFRRRTGLHVAGEQTMLRAKDRPWMRGTVDGFVVVGDDPETSIDDALGVIEFKTDARNNWADGIPANYRAQAIWLAGISGMNHAWIGVMFSRFQFETFELAWTADVAEDWEFMVDAANRFWHDHVLTGTPPPVDGSDATADAIGKVWPNHLPDSIHEASADLAAVLRSRAEIKARMTADKKVVDQLDNELAVIVADAELIAVDGVPAWSYKSQERRTVDAKALRSAHPELDLEPYTNVSTFRVLRPVKEKK